MASSSTNADASRRSELVASATAEERADPAWAWSAYQPDTRRPWDLTRAAHLYRRAAFGANWHQLQQTLSEGPQRTIDRLLKPQADADAFNRTLDDYEDATRSTEGLRAWWLRRMIETPHPLLEKMTLFWHSHFATNGAAVKQTKLMRQHVRCLRRHALGSFASLLQAMSRDPALLIWLGADANRKAAPNESFVKPLMETFTLGLGNFSEDDIRAASQAFTGWFVFRDQLRYIPREHDETPKRVLGREGNFAGEDVIKILLNHPATPRTLARRLYRWLISEHDQPSEALLAPLAESLAQNYKLSSVVETMLRSNLFFSAHAYRARVKCPVEFAVGIAHALEGMLSTTQLAEDLAELGQNLYHPPTVKGWAGGRHWINATALTQRHNLALVLLQGEDPYGDKLDPWAVARKHQRPTPESAAQFLLELFVQDDLDPSVREALLQEVSMRGDGDTEVLLRRLAHAVVTLPEFQLA